MRAGLVFLFLLALVAGAGFCAGCGDDDSASDSDADSDDDDNDDNNDASDDDDDNNDASDDDDDDNDDDDNNDSSDDDDDDNDTGDDDDDDDDNDTGDDDDDDSETPFCQQSCDTPSDCVPASSNAITDANNYDCDDGYCRYLGCLSDAECEEVYMTADYGCDENSSYGTPTCTKKCSTVSECDLGSVLYDEDNYECNGGYCDYTGCNSTQECQEGTMNDDYICAEYTGMDIKLCTLRCDVASDCDFGSGPAYDEDNYDCQDNVCVYTGCNSTEECEQTSSMGSDWDCV